MGWSRQGRSSANVTRLFAASSGQRGQVVAERDPIAVANDIDDFDVALSHPAGAATLRAVRDSALLQIGFLPRIAT